MTSKTLCPLPFMHQYINVTSGVTPCCHVFNTKDWPEQQLDFTKGIYTSSHKLMRKKMLGGIWPNICSKCKLQEQNNQKSHRQMALERFGFPKTKGIKYLDIAFSNKCNLACRMCKPSDSSLLTELYEGETHLPEWVDAEWPPASEQQPDKKVTYVKKLITEGLELLKVTGGEPFACKYFMSVIEWAIEKDYAKNLEINLTTNATKINKTLINKLLKFKKVKLLLSIDGTGTVYNYIRHHASWDKVYNNLKQLSKYSNIDLQVACLVMFHNTTNVIDLIYKCAELNISVYVDQYIKPVTTPITPYHIDENIKSILLKQVSKLEEDTEHWKDSLVKYHALSGAKSLYNIAMSAPINISIRRKLVDTIALQDKLYNTNYKDFLQSEQINYLEGTNNV
jgi:MoaA/NifB/PqqE/SkfB family radical SAM enzyme